MKKVLVAAMGMFLLFGCARVRVEGAKEPIKVDISMRLDIYQHVAKDIDAIESIVSGDKKAPSKANTQSLMHYLVGFAYAQEVLGANVEEAALRRKDRKSALEAWQKQGIIGENSMGLVEMRKPGFTDPPVEPLIAAENKDRMMIYRSIADKNGIPVAEVQKMYAKRLQEDAPSGTPIEVFNGAHTTYEWKIK
ncbi:MAG: DUF1318 domain-containing protein [Candidatus Omnitrophota bacterium]|nr:MAG: DUF1318 domain-containing protein [Candidatus Omnitrophota bacterium]